jgi:hypothetical protein
MTTKQVKGSKMNMIRPDTKARHKEQVKGNMTAETSGTLVQAGKQGAPLLAEQMARAHLTPAQ